VSISRGGTLTIEGKTYNISQIESVYSRRGMQRPLWVRIIALPLLVFLYLCAMGASSAFLAGVFGWNNAEKLTLWEYFFLPVMAIMCLLFASYLQLFALVRTCQLIFQMSSGTCVVFSSDDRKKVESMRDDVINGIERGYFPNYLQQRGVSPTQ